MPWYRPRRAHLPLLIALAAAAVKPELDVALSRESVSDPLSGVVRAGGLTGTAGDPLHQLAQESPRALIRLARERCLREVQDYRCVLLRQERLAGTLGPLQCVAMRYRQQPHSVYLEWLENADQAKRACYVRGRDRDADGADLALIEPAGCVLRMFAAEVRIAVDGERARASSRQTLDKAGHAGTYAAIEAVNRTAALRGELDLRYLGIGAIDGRETYVLLRELPYAGEGGAYPNAQLVLHLDRAWLLPVGIYTYADRDRRILLGSYTMTKVEINVGLTDTAFAF